MEPTTDRLQTPRAAGMAGVAFALLLGAAIVLMRISVPAGDAADATIDPDRRWAVQLALQIVPFAGIFFLWFMGALRAHTGEAEDRFVATVFLGSGFVFVATLFAAAAAGGPRGEQGSPAHLRRPHPHAPRPAFPRRRAAVFVLATSMIGRMLGVFPKPLAMLGTLVGLVLIVVGAGVPWSELLFPAWALVISLYILRVRRTAAPTDGSGPP
ncbi:hypothetical protein [Streptomyces erythrochromogenes]|uniref:hypothetical protein n=1 Tax=Streptomyces erythrochromogenes TaxID=285574 RepID=UPI0036C6C145